tara:strand:+ start:2730 stop:2927 length:198 start_codon:yes stop_codon:yes gene_type:complete
LESISWTEFKKTALQDIRGRQSTIVSGDGEMAFIAVVAPREAMFDQIVALSSQIEGGREHEKWPE